MDLTRVNYKFQGARYRSGSRNRIIPLVRDKLYAKPELKYRRYEFQTGQQIPPSPVALSTRNNPTIWSVTGEDGRRYLIQPSNTAAEWKLLNHAPGFWPERVPFRSLPSPADFQPGVIGIFPPCCPPDLTYLEHAPLLHLHPARPRNIIAQIFARDARPRSKTIGGSVVISASSRYTASAPSPPPHPVICQHPVSGSKGLIFDYYRPSVCPAEQAGLLLRGACLAMDPSSTLWKLLLAWIKSI